MEILGKEFTPKMSLRSMFVFEQITGKTFEIKNSLDFYVYFYSCLIANRENPSLEFDEFIDYCDEHLELVNEFSELMSKDMKKKELLGDKDVKKKKVK